MNNDTEKKTRQPTVRKKTRQSRKPTDKEGRERGLDEGGGTENLVRKKIRQRRKPIEKEGRERGSDEGGTENLR